MRWENDKKWDNTITADKTVIGKMTSACKMPKATQYIVVFSIIALYKFILEGPGVISSALHIFRTVVCVPQVSLYGCSLKCISIPSFCPLPGPANSK